jgi:hemerythrin
MNSENTSWSKDFELNIPELDEKFHNLFTVLDDLKELKQSTKIDYEAKLNRIISRLDKYSLLLADLNNDLVKTKDTKEIDQYVLNTQKLIIKVDDFILHFESKNRLLLDEIIEYLKKWLMVQLFQARKVFVD